MSVKVQADRVTETAVMLTNEEILEAFTAIKKVHDDLEDETEHTFPTGAQKTRLALMDSVMGKLSMVYRTEADK